MPKAKKPNKRYIAYADGKRVLLDADDAAELGAAFFKKAKPASEVLPGLIGAKQTEALFAGKVRIRPVGRPKLEQPKEQITFRFDAEITKAIKAMGRGYNARVETLLREAFL